MKTISVFGASGLTGKLVIKLALNRGLGVNGFYRTTSDLDIKNNKFFPIESSFDNISNIEKAIRGTIGTIVTFGPVAPNQDIFCSEATENIIKGMKNVGAKRIIVVTGALIGEGYQNRCLDMNLFRKYLIRKSPDLIKDRDEQERKVSDSNLGWTIIKPPRLINIPARGRYKFGEKIKVSMLSRIGREDLAELLLDNIYSSDTVRKILFIKY
ncbi:NAD(P)-dependent oxidoreductase [Bacteroidota bacterium]